MHIHDFSLYVENTVVELCIAIRLMELLVRLPADKKRQPVAG
jgi:hypothetical protein